MLKEVSTNDRGHRFVKQLKTYREIEQKIAVIHEAQLDIRYRVMWTDGTGRGRCARLLRGRIVD